MLWLDEVDGCAGLIDQVRGKKQGGVSGAEEKVPQVKPVKPLQDTGPNAVDFSSMDDGKFKSDCIAKFKSESGQEGIEFSSTIISEMDGSRTVYLRQAEKNEGDANNQHIPSVSFYASVATHGASWRHT